MNTTTLEAQRWEACIHEVGHAAAALLLGMEGIGCAVFSENGVSGVATSKPATATPPRAEDYEPEKLDPLYLFDAWPVLWRNAIFTAAGPAATDLALHPELSETVPTGGDAEMLNAAARSACPGADLLVQICFAAMAAARARALLSPFLWRVELAAEELNRRGRMTADEICAAMYPEIVRPDPALRQADPHPATEKSNNAVLRL